MFLIISLLLLTGSYSTKKRTHGPTHNLDLLNMKPREKKSARFNNKGQVVYDGKRERLSSEMGHWFNLNIMYPSKFKIEIMLVMM